MTEFKSWEESMMEEFLRVAEVAACAATEDAVSSRMAQQIIKVIADADYSAIQKSLQNTRLQWQQALGRSDAQVFILSQELKEAQDSLRWLKDERDALVEEYNRLVPECCYRREEMLSEFPLWDWSRFYEAE